MIVLEAAVAVALVLLAAAAVAIVIEACRGRVVRCINCGGTDRAWATLSPPVCRSCDLLECDWPVLKAS